MSFRVYSAEFWESLLCGMCRGFPGPEMEGPGLRSGLAQAGRKRCLGLGSAGRKRCFGTGWEIRTGWAGLGFLFPQAQGGWGWRSRGNRGLVVVGEETRAGLTLITCPNAWKSGLPRLEVGF